MSIAVKKYISVLVLTLCGMGSVRSMGEDLAHAGDSGPRGSFSVKIARVSVPLCEKWLFS